MTIAPAHRTTRRQGVRRNRVPGGVADPMAGPTWSRSRTDDYTIAKQGRTAETTDPDGNIGDGGDGGRGDTSRLGSLKGGPVRLQTALPTPHANKETGHKEKRARTGPKWRGEAAGFRFETA